jgi:hypothetical protein
MDTRNGFVGSIGNTPLIRLEHASLADSGPRYQSKMWSPEFLKSKGLPVPEWLCGISDRD